MKKQDLLKYFDDNLLDKLFGFCYARTNDSYEAEALCSDIIHALITAAYSDGEIESVYPFIWRVARNVYADFSNNRRKRAETMYEGDSEKILLGVAEEETSDDGEVDSEATEDAADDEEKYYCPECGAEITLDMTQCPKCGVEFEFTEDEE